MTNRRSFLKRVGLLTAAIQVPKLFASVKQPANHEVSSVKNGSWAKLRSEFNLDYSYAHFAGFLLTSHPKIVRDVK